MPDHLNEPKGGNILRFEQIRRQFLLSLGAVGTIGVLGWPHPANAETRAFLHAFADTILPEGELPGAVSVGALGRVFERADADAGFATILDNATRSVDEEMLRQIGVRFADASAGHRQQVVAALERLPATDLLGWFFVAVRAEIFFHYYAQAGTERTVGLEGPPQPAGFDDIDKPWIPS